MGGKIKKALREIWINKICSSSLISVKVRYRLYRIAGMNIAKSIIRYNCRFDGYWKVTINKGVFINCNAYFDCNGRITIGENAFIGNYVILITTTHEIGSQNKRAGTSYYLPIEIGNGCWIGAKSTILPGVKIGDGCIIAAGSVVTRNCEPNGLYAGVPAVRKKDLPVK